MPVVWPVIVDTDGDFRTSNANDQLPSNVGDQLENGSASSIPFGTPCYPSGAGALSPAQANAAATSSATHLYAGNASVGAGQTGTFYGAGSTLDCGAGNTALWDAITGGSGGIVFGTKYWLDPNNAGKLVTTPPTVGSGKYNVLIGIGLSSTAMRLVLRMKIKV